MGEDLVAPGEHFAGGEIRSVFAPRRRRVILRDGRRVLERNRSRSSLRAADGAALSCFDALETALETCHGVGPF
jgi:hypothetical protein